MLIRPSRHLYLLLPSPLLENHRHRQQLSWDRSVWESGSVGQLEDEELSLFFCILCVLHRNFSNGLHPEKRNVKQSG